ncbi:hypothetical protein B5K06_08200 [Rhizobium grahamii]|uniref:Uncharacterized protein n=1 Tax=Rhizobium grahamii TaxID=1120045 RepID=A0A370KTH5_9HYPH|nr:hypothetical protein B5K06_08200 [Rhizobium grahamii]
MHGAELPRRPKVALIHHEIGEVTVHAEVDFNLSDGSYFLSAHLNVSVPGVTNEVAWQHRRDHSRGLISIRPGWISVSGRNDR